MGYAYTGRFRRLRDIRQKSLRGRETALVGVDCIIILQVILQIGSLLLVRESYHYYTRLSHWINLSKISIEI